MLYASPLAANIANLIQPSATPIRAVSVLQKKISANFCLSVAPLCFDRVYLLAGVPLKPYWFSLTHNLKNEKGKASMTTNFEGSYDLSKTNRNEFSILFEFASTCDMSNSDPNIEPTEFAFISILLATFKQWRIDTGRHSDVMPSVQYVLGFEHLRSELTEMLFKHGSPTDAEIETVFRLLFQVAYVRQKLASQAAVKVSNSP